jgi:WD40 repeat protein/serine/threonine protein kinase/two-component SAPR family response regulator
MASLSLKMLGEFEARLGDQLIPGFRTIKVQALLVYLAVESGRHSRESVMELLWPGMPERSARHNLRQILYNLRGTIPEVDNRNAGDESLASLLLTNRHMITLNPDAAVSSDVSEFEQLLVSVQQHEHLALLSCPVCKSSLGKAVSYYKGEFLADFYLVDSNEFEDWAQMTRQLYRRKVLDALEILTTLATREKDYPAARSMAERQLEIDNLRESGYRQLMEILALSGHREEALSVYESLRRLLAEELAMQPASRTTKMYEQIMAGDLSFESRRTQGVRGYELKEKIGSGAHGAILRAIQPVIGREVAVKVIHRRYANDPEFIRRFEDEAQIIARLEHPYIVPLYDYWRDNEGAYLVMRYLQGGNLLSALENGPWDAEQAVEMLDQVAPALAAAHRMGVIHRDIKPANILFDNVGNAYLSDFSIAKRLDRDRQWTASGSVLGTPDYISPEQILDEQVSAQSDLYSLGAVLYETLTGEKPFGDLSMANLLYKHINEPFPLVSSSRPDLPPAIDEVIQQATAKRPSDRYADALEMAAAFRRVLSGDSQTFLVKIGVEVGEALENPYKGLRPFQEMDADDFFGRDALIDRLVARLTPEPPLPGREWDGENGRFLAVVGPSGSGKSSAIKAGLIPALRSGAVPGSDKWFVVEMSPGTHPLEELEMALWAVAVDAPPSLVEPMQQDIRGMLRTIRRILPDADAPEGGPQLLLIIDQFEELFTLVDEEERRAFFLDSLLAAVSAPRSPLRVILTLRADFYDRPLQYQTLGKLIKHNTEVVLPLTPEELTWAIREPARRVGVHLEEGLAEVIIADVADQAGGLPLLQYALTELFERRRGNQLTLDAYQEIGGVRGALGRRAEALYSDLDPTGQETTRQLFLRLVTLGEGTEDTRRRVLQSELETIIANPVQLNEHNDEKNISKQQQATIIDKFGAARLLTFDRDAMTRSPTVEMAHEALLREWRRLRGWLAESRDDVRSQRLLANAAGEWVAANKDESYLLRGARLSQLEGWAAAGSVALTDIEHTFLEKSIAGQTTRRAEEEARRQRELDTARKLVEMEKARAETESRRAEEQHGAARRLQRLAVLLAVMMVVAVTLAFLAVQSSQEAEQLAQVSKSRELAAAANNNLDIDPELSLLLALEAINITPAVEAEDALHQALLASRVRLRLPGHEGIIERVAYSPDGSLIASAVLEKGLASIWEAESGKMLHQMPIGNCCLGLNFDNRGRYIAAVEANDQFTIGVWDVGSGEKEESITLPFSPLDVFFYALAPDWEQVAVGFWEGGVEVWDLEREEILFELSGYEGSVELEYSQDGRRLVSNEWEAGRVIVWDAQTGESLQTIEIGQSIQDHVVSPDGRWVALSTSLDTSIQIWGMVSSLSDETLEPTITLTGHESPIFLLAFSPDGTKLASASRDGSARVWDVTSGQELVVLHHGERVRSLAFHPVGDRLLTGDFGGNVRVWDVTPQGSTERLALATHSEVKTAAYSTDGSLLVTGGWDNLGRIWNPETGALIHMLEGHSAVVFDTTFHPEGRQVATASTDGTVRIWDTQTGEALMVLEGHGDGDVGGIFTGVLGVDYNPAGDRLATVGADGTLRIWDVDSGNELMMIKEVTGLVNVIFSPDGQYLVYGTDFSFGKAVIRNAETLEIEMTVPTGTQVWGLGFSPDGRFLATAGGDTSVYLWALDYNIGQAAQLATLEGHATTAGTLRFSPDGRLLATATRSEVRLWDVSALTEDKAQPFIPELFLLPGGAGTAFSPDGKELVSGGLNGLVRSYLLDVGALISLAHERLTRGWTEQECQQFLHLEACPVGLSD